VCSGPLWTGQWHGLSRDGATLEQGTPGAAGLRSSLGEAEEGHGDEAVLMRGSPRHDLRCRSGAVARKNGGGSSSARAWKKAGERSGMRAKGVGMAGGGAHPFIWSEGHRGGCGRAVLIIDIEG
jgi:hypothetical protein